MKIPALCMALVVHSQLWAMPSATAIKAFSNTMHFPASDSLRSALIRSNPTYFTDMTTSISERESFIGPLEPALRAITFWKYVGPVVLHYKFTEVWFQIADVDPTTRAITWEKLHAKYAPTSLEAILELRGLFVKIGQVMSSRADFVPSQYVDCFHTLQDAVPPWEKERVVGIVRESLRDSQGLDFEDVFEEFGEVLGSASIGQVHKAKLSSKYGGETVAVKVMHPNAQQKFRNDFKVFRSLCKVALPGWDPILRELEMQMMTEFDYHNEAKNLDIVRKNMAMSPFADRVCVPEPVSDLCSNNVLVMEYLSGKKFAVSIEENMAKILGGDVQMARKVLKAKQQSLFETSDVVDRGKKSFFQELRDIVGENNDELTLVQKGAKAVQLMRMTRDARNKLSLLLDVTGHQIFHDGVYNGDPHPGNILVLDDGRLGLIDYGQTRTLTTHDRLALARVVVALGKKHLNAHEISDAMRNFGFRSTYNNDEIIAKFAALYFDSDIAGKRFSTPQKYLEYLNSMDRMVKTPDPAVFVARTSFLFRGLGCILQQQLHTSYHWRNHASMAVDTNGRGRPLYNLGLTPIPAEAINH